MSRPVAGALLLGCLVAGVVIGLVTVRALRSVLLLLPVAGVPVRFAPAR